MKIRKTVRYICDHCSKGFWKKEDCLRHEGRCYKNPAVKSCWNCKSFAIMPGEPFFCEIYEMDLCIKPENKTYEMKYLNEKCVRFSRKG